MRGAMRAPHHNFVVIVPMIMKFGTDVKLDVLYTMVSKNCDVTTITSLWRHNLYLVDQHRPKFQMLVTPKPPTGFDEIWYLEVFRGAFFKYQLRFHKLLKFRYK